MLQDAPHPPDIDSLIPSYWRRLVAICPSDERHYKPCAQLNAAQRSSPHNVSVQPFRFGGLGVWNTLTFSTVTEGGQHKSRGGDVWVAVLADTARGRRVPARVFDLVSISMCVHPSLCTAGSYRRTCRATARTRWRSSRCVPAFTR